MSGERKRILWVEDSARFDLAKIVGPIYRARRFHLSLAEDATSAVRMLSSNTFDVVVMDIRIPPGEDEFWIKRYQDNGSDASQAKLGLLVLRWLFDKSWEYRADLPQTPPWVNTVQFAVFSVERENEIGEDLKKLGIATYQEKVPGSGSDVLLKLIDRVLKNQKPGEDGS